LSAVGRAEADRGLTAQDGKPAEKAWQVAFSQFVLPYSDYSPAFRSQQPVHSSIPCPVAGDLVSPERGAGLGPGRVPGAAVPDLSAVGRAEAEAAVHKHRGLALGLRVRQLFRSGEYYISTRFIAGLVWCIDN